MKGDFTRNTFDPAKHFSHVFSQQGRVTLDADPNEQAAILLHYLRTLARDLIGAYAAPAENRGFVLTTNTTNPPNLNISQGRYYVDGYLVKNDDPDCLYNTQKDFPAVAKNDDLLLSLLSKNSNGPIGSYWGFYLDVWERHITWIEDPSIREPALLGPDTCTRAKVIWQVRSMAMKTQSQPTCADLFKQIPRPAKGEMSARIDPGPVTDASPCVTPPASQYRGTENQLYRVEIHRPGTIVDAKTTPTPVQQVPVDPPTAATTAALTSVQTAKITAPTKDQTLVLKSVNSPTFKWSRDNGSIVTAWSAPLAGTATNGLNVASDRGFAAGDWVELSDDNDDLLGLPGLLVQLTKVQGDVLSITPPTSGSVAFSNYGPHPKVRRWNQSQNADLTLQDGAVPITAGNWIDLENGIQIMFQPGDYRTGDYWLIPARVATANIEWPQRGNEPAELPPVGIEHHYAPLAIIEWGDGHTNLTPCDCTFNPGSSCYQSQAAQNHPATPPVQVATAPVAAVPVG
jgi:hypothetical protein